MIPFTRLLCLAAVGLLSTPAALHGEARISSWLTTYSGQYARVYETDADRTSGTTLTTWPRGTRVVNGGLGGQTAPTYCGIHEVSYSPDWVYLKTTGLGSHVMGPWYSTTAHTTLFMNMPVNKALIYRIPRNPAYPNAGAKMLTGGGPIGLFVDGVVMYDSRDAFSYTQGSGSPGTEANGVGNWNRDAFVNESQTFDPANAHQPGSGQYHYHANPPALRYLLGDNILFNSTTKAYTEDTGNANLKHSPILGWVRDGFPIYGPYGYSDPLNAASGVSRMISGFVPRNTADAAVTNRTTLPAWAVRAQSLASNAFPGPVVSAQRPFGRYLEDNEYRGDLGQTQGVEFDLDEFNGRFCVTPEFPGGTYAYFTAITSTGAPAFPYNIGRRYYGAIATGPNGSGVVTSITESVTTAFSGGPNAALNMQTPIVDQPAGDVTLTWSSVEGGTYKLEGTDDFSNWSNTSIPATPGVSTQAVDPGAANAVAKRFYRVSRTALNPYDSTGF